LVVVVVITGLVIVVIGVVSGSVVTGGPVNRG